MADLLYGYATEYAEEAHIVGFPAPLRLAMCGPFLEWIPANQFPPASVCSACRTALANGAQPAAVDLDDEPAIPEDVK